MIDISFFRLFQWDRKFRRTYISNKLFETVIKSTISLLWFPNFRQFQEIAIILFLNIVITLRNAPLFWTL